SGQRVGVANEGYWGIPIKPNTTYRASFYARASGEVKEPLRLSIEAGDGASTVASANVSSISTRWKKYTAVLKTGAVRPSAFGRFVISTATPGTMWFSLVSLFPPTFGNRPNGNRPDLMQLLAAMKPAFLRFPGGNYLEGPDY